MNINPSEIKEIIDTNNRWIMETEISLRETPVTLHDEYKQRHLIYVSVVILIKKGLLKLKKTDTHLNIGGYSIPIANIKNQ